MSLLPKSQGDIIEAGELAILKTTNIRSFAFTWSFDDVHSLAETETLTSHAISVDPQNEWKIYISVVNGYITIGLQLFKCSEGNKITAKYQINVLTSDARSVGIAGPEFTREFTVGHYGVATDYILKVGLVHPRHTFLTQGRTLNLHCQISTFHGVPVPLNNTSEAENQQNFLLKNFLIEGSFADVTVATRTLSLPVCKIMLASKSPVFKSMFETSMTESTENVVRIEDFSDDAVMQLMEFIYTGKTKINEANVTELLKIGDKYQVMDLKEECEQALIKKINVQNAVDVLILAHFHNPTSLKPKVMEFINRYKQEILGSDAFDELQAYPELLVELCRVLLK